MQAALLATAASWFVLLSGCAGSLPTPELTQHPQDAYIEVPYPPPAALVEVVPEPRPRGTAWVDGHWVWRGRYYAWQRGGWMAVPDGISYATWQCFLSKDGRLLFAPGAWYDDRRRAQNTPRAVVNAHTPPNQITPETAAPR